MLKEILDRSGLVSLCSMIGPGKKNAIFLTTHAKLKAIKTRLSEFSRAFCAKFQLSLVPSDVYLSYAV